MTNMYGTNAIQNALGAEEEGDDTVIATTSRTLPKIPPTSDAPRTERTTLKTQTKVPLQTKVCASCFVFFFLLKKNNILLLLQMPFVIDFKSI